MPTPDLSKLAEVLAATMDTKKMECPHCQKEFGLSLVPKLQKQTVLTMVYKLEAGHMMQAVSIGGSIAAMGKLLRATAKHIGGNVEVFVNDARFKDREIEFDFLILPAPDSLKAGNRKRTTFQGDGG